MSDSLDEMISWANANGDNVEDLILLLISHCEGDICSFLTSELVESKGIKYIDVCRDLKNMTVEDAYNFAKLEGGGAILAVEECIEDNYDDTITCSGYPDESKHFELKESNVGILIDETSQGLPSSNSYNCFKYSKTRDFPFDRMNKYIKDTVAKGPPNNKLWQV